ncbi:Uma2 family endonuclease [Actinokineospora sp.]|uniref:Uma2 family endonuclease n=1 Tax=Actinokineospora sp. TaxID=1872133 RepID=UPI00403820F5
MPVENYEFPRHPQSWTLQEILAMPEDQGQRVELIDGAVVLSPAPGAPHQRVLQRLQVGLPAALPPHLELLPGVNVVLNSQRLLIPDLVVVTVPDADRLYFHAADVLLAAEVISPSSRSYDKAQKRALYAEARIPFYLLVDPVPRPASAVLFALDGEEYTKVAASVQGRLRFAEPFPADLDLA